jgi:hypothetical protein
VRDHILLADRQRFAVLDMAKREAASLRAVAAGKVFESVDHGFGPHYHVAGVGLSPLRISLCGESV